MSDFDQNTDFTTAIEDMLERFHRYISILASDGTEVSNERVSALQAELITPAQENSVDVNKLMIVGASFQTDVKAIAALRDLSNEVGLTLLTLRSLQNKRAMSFQAMQGHLDSIEAGNGPTLQRSASSKLH